MIWLTRSSRHLATNGLDKSSMHNRFLINCFIPAFISFNFVFTAFTDNFTHFEPSQSYNCTYIWDIFNMDLLRFATTES